MLVCYRNYNQLLVFVIHNQPTNQPTMNSNKRDLFQISESGREPSERGHRVPTKKPRFEESIAPAASDSAAITAIDATPMDTLGHQDQQLDAPAEYQFLQVHPKSETGRVLFCLNNQMHMQIAKQFCSGGSEEQVHRLLATMNGDVPIATALEFVTIPQRRYRAQTWCCLIAKTRFRLAFGFLVHNKDQDYI